MQQDDSNLVYDTQVRVLADAPDKAPVVAPSWTAVAASGEVKPLEAHHKMLHEGAVLSSHLKTYENSINRYLTATKQFLVAADDFIISTGQPSKYQARLSAAGVQAASAVAATAAAAQANPDSPTAAYEALEPSQDSQTSAATPASASPRGSSSSSSSSSSTPRASAFAREAAEPALPLQGPIGGVHMFPAVPGSPALAAVGLTDIVTADILLPGQHQQLFRHDEQRRLVSSARDELSAAFSDRFFPAIKQWGATYEECKLLLPQVERMRLQANKVRGELEAAKRKVLEAESSQPLMPPAAVAATAGGVPRVLTHTAAEGQLVAAPAAAERQEMYKKEQEQTDAELAFELSEKVLRDKLSWLMRTGAALRALAAVAAAAALQAAAAEGSAGEAAGGTAVGNLRAPKDELLEPFPQHVLARLRGEHLPTLPQLVTSDLNRVQRWITRFKDAMAQHAAATAAAAGAQLLAAATAAPTGPAAATDPATAAAAAVVPPAAGTDDLIRTDDPEAHHPAAAAGSSTMEADLQQAADEAQVPLDLLAAAVAADVEEEEIAAAAATRVETAWRLLHDVSIMAGKQESVLVPLVRKHISPAAADVITTHLHQLESSLSALGSVSPSSAAFDLAVLEAVEVINSYNKELEQNILPALSAKLPPPELRSLARSYRKAAATAPSRPHGWFLGAADNTTSSNSSGRGTTGAAAHKGSSGAANAAAAMKRLLGRPAKAGVALVDAAADVARFGPGRVPARA